VCVVIKILEHTFAATDPTSPYPLPSSLPPLPLPLPVALILSYAALDMNFTSWMTPENLRVLQIETEADDKRPPSRTPSLSYRRTSSSFYGSDEEDDRKEGWANMLRGTKDHLSHVSPLAVVGDNHHRSKIRRKKSWKQSLRDLAQSSEVSTPRPKPLRARKNSHSKRHAVSTTIEEGTEADGEAAAEILEFRELPEEEKPIRARVRWNYGGGYSPAATPPTASPERSPIMLPKLGNKDQLGPSEQEKLQAEVAEADSEVADQRRREVAVARTAPVGTLLTMTSRTGYFSDRIISPSMMRAMAILYIGPHRNPDFASDYHISPILAPTRLLAQFPPLLMQCGEKDPFVDDTIIFAGRVREAKRKRKEELRRLISERMGGSGFRKSESLTKLEDELDKLDNEEEEDWVQIQIFPDWSHGYLQMPMLMKEATEVIDDLAKWIESAFVIHASSPSESTSDATSLASSPVSNDFHTSTSILASLWPWRGKSTAAHEQTNIEPANVHTVRIALPKDESSSGTGHRHMNARSFVPSETETEPEDIITFVPKARRPSQGTTSSFGSEGTAAHESPTYLHRVTSPLDESSASPKEGNSAVVRTTATSGGAVNPANLRVSSRRRSSRSRTRGSAAPPSSSPPNGSNGSERPSRSLTMSPGRQQQSDAHKSGVPGKAGVMAQTLTESELVRRRRLLDSHIFQSEPEVR